jgi:hypothetical protein
MPKPKKNALKAAIDIDWTKLDEGNASSNENESEGDTIPEIEVIESKSPKASTMVCEKCGNAKEDCGNHYGKILCEGCYQEEKEEKRLEREAQKVKEDLAKPKRQIVLDKDALIDVIRTQSTDGKSNSTESHKYVMLYNRCVKLATIRNSPASAPREQYLLNYLIEIIQKHQDKIIKFLE